MKIVRESESVHIPSGLMHRLANPGKPGREARFPFPTSGERVTVGPDGRNRLRNVEAVLRPGTYHGLEISAGSVVRLEPGIYLFTGDLVIGGAQLLGENVLLAFSRARFWMRRRAVVRLTAPDSGTYAKVQFIEDPGHRAGDSWISVGCEATLEYAGMMLLPNASIWVFDGAVLRGTGAIDSGTIWLQAGCDLALTCERACPPGPGPRPRALSDAPGRTDARRARPIPTRT